MSIKNIFFDLDGTLLPMDQDHFIKTYLFALAKKMTERSYDADKFIATIMQSIKVMIKNDGTQTNESAFWNFYTDVYGAAAKEDEAFLEGFYQNEFQAFKSVCGFEPRSNELIKKLKRKGFRLVLATNPLFPRIATESRIKWAGLDKDDFEFITTYENIGYSKPNPLYYSDIAMRLGMKSNECLMIGNDVRDDMAALEVGMDAFLLTDGLINIKNVNITQYQNGSFSDLEAYLDTL